MEEKLILKHRGDYDYFLLSRTENSEAVQASLIPDDEFEQKLSKQNCDDIFGIYSPSELSQILTEGGKGAFEFGYCLAREHNKDKLFTMEDIKGVIKKARLLARLKEDYGYDEYMFDEEDIIQSIQQPTEIEVEIVIYTQDDLKSIENDWSKLNTPKLDENGCLILKRA
jgi:hypothetical protein